MKVYLAMRGEDYEGGRVLGVFDSRSKAKKKLFEEMKEDVGYVIKYNDRDKIEKRGANRFAIGCDWFAIEEWEVK